MKCSAKHNFLFNNQHRFQQGHARGTQLIELITDPHQAVRDSLKIEAIFNYLKKAFDEISHARLLMKLTQFNIQSKIQNWITVF